MNDERRMLRHAHSWFGAFEHLPVHQIPLRGKDLVVMYTRKVHVKVQLVPQSEPYIDLEHMQEIVGFHCCSNLRTIDGSEMLAHSFLGQTIQYNGHTYTITEYIQKEDRPEFLCAATRPITFEPFFVNEHFSVEILVLPKPSDASESS
jgi:hypothetical protein